MRTFLNEKGKLSHLIGLVPTDCKLGYEGFNDHVLTLEFNAIGNGDMGGC